MDINSRPSFYREYFFARFAHAVRKESRDCHLFSRKVPENRGSYHRPAHAENSRFQLPSNSWCPWNRLTSSLPRAARHRPRYETSMKSVGFSITANSVTSLGSQTAGIRLGDRVVGGIWHIANAHNSVPACCHPRITLFARWDSGALPVFEQGPTGFRPQSNLEFKVTVMRHTR